jgi:hypothetical protein
MKKIAYDMTIKELDLEKEIDELFTNLPNKNKNQSSAMNLLKQYRNYFNNLFINSSFTSSSEDLVKFSLINKNSRNELEANNDVETINTSILNTFNLYPRVNI